MEDSVTVPAALLLGSAALGNGGGIQMPDIRGGDPAKRAVIQCCNQIVDAVKMEFVKDIFAVVNKSSHTTLWVYYKMG